MAREMECIELIKQTGATRTNARVNPTQHNLINVLIH